MLNDEFAERTLPPTERRRREARILGQAARSSELTFALLILTASGALWHLAPTAASALAALTRTLLTTSPRSTLTVETAVEMTQAGARIATAILAPILIFAMVAVFVGNFAQTGWLWIPSAAAPRRFISGLISEDSLPKALTAVFRLCVSVGICVHYFLTQGWELHSVGSGEPIRMLLVTARMLGELSIQLSLGLIVIAIIDYGFQYWRNEQRLKMSVEEYRRERQEDSANPQIIKRRNESTTRRNLAISPSEVGRIEAT